MADEDGMKGMEPAHELLNLQERHQRLLREHAVLESREAEKAKRREELRTLLLKAGVNPDDPEVEAARLEAELNQIQTENEAKLDDFEVKLKAATQGQPLLTEDVNQPSMRRGPLTKSEPPDQKAPATTSAPTQDSEPSKASAPNVTSEPHEQKGPAVLSELHVEKEPSDTSEPPTAREPKIESGPTFATIDLC